MIKANVQKLKEAPSTGNSTWIQKSGVYLLHIKGIEEVPGNKDAIAVNYIAEECISYNNTIVNMAGDEVFGMDILQSLLIVTGQAQFSDAVSAPIQFNSGPQNKTVYPESVGLTVYATVHFRYRVYNKTIREDKIIRNFFSIADKASASELLQSSSDGSESKGSKGDAYKAALAYYETDRVTYEGVTAEEVAAWRQAQMNPVSVTPDADTGVAPSSDSRIKLP